MDPTLYGDYQEQTGVWTVLNRLMLMAILVVFCIGGIIAFVPLIRQNSAVLARIETLQATVKEEKAELARNTKEVEWLQNNPEYLEVQARDRLNLMKPGEVIIRLEEVPLPGGEAPAAIEAQPE